MGDKRYIISDASKLVDVESHVLRYWEEELGIDIPRNEMGHRYYTDIHINLLKNVKELKDCGFQLRAIKILIPELMALGNESEANLETLKGELFQKVAKLDVESELFDNTENVLINIDSDNSKKIEGGNALTTANIKATPEEMKATKMEQFQIILSEIVNNALKENTSTLGKEVSDIVSDNVIKEMDYLMHLREKQEEERFKKLDETIRNYQSSRKESAVKNSGVGLFAKLKRL